MIAPEKTQLNPMKKALFSLLSLSALVLWIGCNANQQRIAYNSLASTGTTEQTAFEAYMDSVFKGITKTNDVPRVAEAHRQFKAVFDSACALAGSSTNWITPPAEVYQAAAEVQQTISNAKANSSSQ